jgi:hypothetical protein
MFARTRIAAALTAAALLFAAPALAEPVAAPARAASAPNPEAVALVRRYLAAIHFERTMDSVQAAMLPVMTEQLAQAHREVTPEQRQIVVDVVRRVMREKMLPQMIDRLTPIYAQTFTAPELQAMVAFYESPIGQSIADKAPSLAPRTAEIVRELQPAMAREVVLEIIARICPNGKCETAKPPNAAAS